MLLRESGIPFEKVNYYTAPLNEEKLRELLRKMKMKPRELLRTSEPLYRNLHLKESAHTDDELIALMVKHPDLMQRPIVERGQRAVLGRPVENVRALISDE
jgi:arsenate reductase